MSDGERLVLDARPLAFERNDLPTTFSGFFRAVYLAGAIVGCIAGLAGDMGIGTLAYFGPLLAWPLLIVSYLLSVFPRKTMGRLEVLANGDLVIVENGGRSAVPRKDITGALVVLRDDVVTAEIQMVGGDRILATMKDVGEARAFVERLGFGPRGARIETALAKPTRRLLHLVAACVAWVAGSSVTAIMLSEIGRGDAMTLLTAGIAPLVTFVLYHLLRFSIRAPVVVIGDDGVFLKTALRPRVVRRGAALRDILDPILSIAIEQARIDAVLRTVAERHSESATTDESVAAFARGERSLAEWRADLRAKMDQGGYRAAATPADTAEAVLRNVRATAEARIGAAVALRVAGEPGERIRIAADATADELLRDALEAVADDDDERIEKKLAKVRAR